MNKFIGITTVTVLTSLAVPAMANPVYPPNYATWTKARFPCAQSSIEIATAQVEIEDLPEGVAAMTYTHFVGDSIYAVVTYKKEGNHVKTLARVEVLVGSQWLSYNDPEPELVKQLLERASQDHNAANDQDIKACISGLKKMPGY